jgi:hypothetical protein
MLEGLARDKRSSLLRTFVNYGRKKFYNIGSGGKNFRLIGPEKKLARFGYFRGAMTFLPMLLPRMTLCPNASSE